MPPKFRVEGPILLLFLFANRGVLAQQDQEPTATDAIDAATVATRALSEALPSKSLTHFGTPFFLPKDSGEDVSNRSINPHYLLGPGDEIIIHVWGDWDLDLQLQVNDQGYIEIPEQNRLYVNGLKFEQLEAAVLRELRNSHADLLSQERLASRNIFIEVALGTITGIQAVISGAVNNPGVYQFPTSSVTLLQALAQAGGVGSQGSLRTVKIQRDSGRNTIDLYDFLLEGNVDLKEYQIRDNNMVFVPLRAQTVSIRGAIKRPAIYEILDHETLDDALRIAGGMKFDADRSYLQIKRVHPISGPQLVDIDLTDQDAAETQLMDGDDLMVHYHTKRRRQFSVTISGKGVRKPGIYQLAPATTLWNLIDNRVGLHEDAIIERVEHIRRNQDFTQTLQLLDLSDALAGNIELHPEDQIIIHSTHDLQGGDKSVHVRGHVKSPGSYSLTGGLTLYDLLFRAGGLSDPDFRAQSYLERGNLVRTDVETGKRKILSFSVSNVLAGVENLDLHSEDKVVIYAAEEFKDHEQVTIQGAIRQPGQYPLREAMTLTDLIVEARGLRANAYKSRAEVARLTPHDNPSEEVSLQTLFVPLDAATDKFVLKDNDVVFIRQTPGLQSQLMATITGEVRFPGAYSLTGENERLSHLIARAGGLTEHAFLEGCRFTRQRNGERKRVAVDLEKELSGSEEQDVLLKEGDKIHIPSRDWVVAVQGAVQIPQLVQYAPNKKVRYYVDLVGGFQPSADVDAAYIIRANQLILKASNRYWFDPTVPPGSTLVIPSREAARDSRWNKYGLCFIAGAIISGLAVHY